MEIIVELVNLFQLAQEGKIFPINFFQPIDTVLLEVFDFGFISIVKKFVQLYTGRERRCLKSQSLAVMVGFHGFTILGFVQCRNEQTPTFIKPLNDISTARYSVDAI